MCVVKYRISLDKAEMCRLRELAWGDSRRSVDARIILWSDTLQGDGQMQLSSREIAARLKVGLGRISRVRRRFTEGGVEAAIFHRRRRRPSRWKANQLFEERLLEVFRSPPPRGMKKWSLRKLAERMVELKLVPTVSHETVRAALRRYADSGAA